MHFDKYLLIFVKIYFFSASPMKKPLLFLLFFAIYATANCKFWFGIPDDRDEITVERSLVSGVRHNDTIWDLSDIEVIDDNIGYRCRRTSDSTYIYREGLQRLFFKTINDSLSLTGSENRLGRSLGKGIVQTAWNSGTFESGYYYRGKHEQMWEYVDSGKYIVSHFKASIIYGADTLRNLRGIRMMKIGALKFLSDTTLVTATDTLESFRLYSPRGSHPIVEGRRLYSTEKDFSYFVLNSVIVSGVDADNAVSVPKDDDNPEHGIHVTVSPEYITVGFDIDSQSAHDDVEIILCSFSGICYWSKYFESPGPGHLSVRIPRTGIPSGSALLIINTGQESVKRIVEI